MMKNTRSKPGGNFQGAIRGAGVYDDDLIRDTRG
jgi:hypothetical protein